MSSKSANILLLILENKYFLLIHGHDLKTKPFRILIWGFYSGLVNLEFDTIKSQKFFILSILDKYCQLYYNISQCILQTFAFIKHYPCKNIRN